MRPAKNMVKVKLCKYKKVLENSNIRFALTKPTHNRSSFCQRNHRKFGCRFDKANTNNCQNFVKNASKLQNYKV